jgi:Double zinc ribbon
MFACRRCGRSNDDDARLCQDCRAPLRAAEHAAGFLDAEPVREILAAAGVTTGG